MSKAIIKDLNIDPVILKECKEMMANPKYSRYYKRAALKRILGVSICNCGAIPTKQICHDVGDADIPFVRLEHFCDSCYQNKVAREKEEPKTKSKKALAEFYGCVIGEPNVRH